MSDKESPKLTNLLSALALILYAVIIAIKWVMVYQDVPVQALNAVDIIRTIVMCLMFFIIMCNALTSTRSIIFKIIFLAIGVFLIASAIAVRVPAVAEFFTKHSIPPVF